MKIIGLDKYDREWRGDELVAGGFDKNDTEDLAKELNRDFPNNDRLYIVVSDGYHLNPGVTP